MHVTYDVFSIMPKTHALVRLLFLFLFFFAVLLILPVINNMLYLRF